MLHLNCMKSLLEQFAQGVYDALQNSETPDLFSWAEIEEYVVLLFRSLVNKTAVLIGIIAVSIFMLIQRVDASWFFSTALIFWMAWTVSTSVVVQFVQQFRQRKK